MTNAIVFSSNNNLERIPRRRAIAPSREHKTRPDRRELQVQRELDHKRIGNRISDLLLSKYGGWYECETLYQLTLAMEAKSVINCSIVRDQAVRRATITAVIKNMVATGRIVCDETPSDGKDHCAVWFGAAKSLELLQYELAEIEAHRENKKRNRQERLRQAQATRLQGHGVAASRAA